MSDSTSSDSKYIAYGHIHPNNLKKFSLGGGLSITKGEWENNDHPFVKLAYSARKHMSRHNRNHNLGTKTLLKQGDINDLGVHEGNGFFSSLKNIFSNPITKSIVKTIAPIAINAGKSALAGVIASKTGNPALGDAISGAAGDLAQSGTDQYTGSGIRRRGGGKKKGAGFLQDLGGMFGGGVQHKGGSMLPLGGHIGGGLHAKTIKNAKVTSAMINATEERQNGVAVNQSPTLDFKNSPQFEWSNIPERMKYLRSKRNGRRNVPAQDKLM